VPAFTSGTDCTTFGTVGAVVGMGGGSGDGLPSTVDETLGRAVSCSNPLLVTQLTENGRPPGKSDTADRLLHFSTTVLTTLRCDHTGPSDAKATSAE
jgi:hypothetical protein